MLPRTASLRTAATGLVRAQTFSTTAAALKISKRRKMPTKTVVDNDGNPIKENDYVMTLVQRGWHGGVVEQVVRTKPEATSLGVGKPPKVLFTDQKGNYCAFSPTYLKVTERAAGQ